jgi:hypothetical protein
MGRN